MSNLLKNLLIALGLAIILFIGYFIFFRGDSDTPATVTPFSAEAEIATQQLLTTLNELKGYNVEGDIFDDPLFLSLVDLRVDLGSEDSGRQNPFAPLQ